MTVHHCTLKHSMVISLTCSTYASMGLTRMRGM